MAQQGILRPPGAFGALVGGLFAFTCFQAAFLTPYTILVSGERTNLFSPLLMALTAVSLLALPAVRSRLRFTLEAWGWLALAGLLAASALTSADPGPAFLRACAFWVPAVTGLLCARHLLRSRPLRHAFFAFLVILLAGLSLLHLAFGPDVLGLHSHALAGMLLLLSVGPLYFFLSGGRGLRVAALLLLGLGYLAGFLAGSRFLVLLPLVLIPLFAGQKRLPRRMALAGLAASLLLVLCYFSLYPREIPRLYNYESVFYRLEGYPAAWEIIKQKPLLGIGIRIPRVEYLGAFKPLWGIVGARRYLKVVGRNITFDNQLLSLLVETGVPATLLYLGLLGYLLRRFRGNLRAGRLDRPSEGALTFALFASLIHFLVCDGLYFPQTNWFFHVMLGLAAGAQGEPSAPEKEGVVNPELPARL